jgi:TetR/AcrR family transcriptional regulator
MNIEGRQDTDRLTYIYETYIEPVLKDVGRLLAHLADEGVVRPIPLRTFHFPLAHGATAPHALVPLATKFDTSSPSEPAAIEEHAQLVSTLLVEPCGCHRDECQTANLREGDLKWLPLTPVTLT